MTEEEWKAFEAHLESIVDPQPDQTKFYHSVLLAYKELKERREAGDGADRAVAERIRQKSVEGWTPEHDAQHDQGEIALAAACYVMNKMPSYQEHWQVSTLDWWPWHPDWDKREKHDRERSLEIAAALIMAELDRLRAARGK